MRNVMVRYKVKSDRVEENRDFVVRMFDALNAARPEGLRYACFQLPDGVSFVHIASIDDANGHDPLREFQPFKEFVADIRERCDEPPNPTPLTPVGDYRLISA